MTGTNVEASPVTVKAVVAYANKLIAEAQREIVVDVYASPYMPTEAGARRLSERLGPEAAIANMRERAAMHKRDEREHAVQAQRALERHARRQTRAARDRDMARQGLTLGARADQTIAALRMIASPPSSKLDADRVHGGDSAGVPLFCVDMADKAVRVIRVAVVQAERMLDDARARDVSKAA